MAGCFLATAPSSKLLRILLLSALALFSISFLYLHSLHPTVAPSLSNARSSSPFLVGSEVYHSLFVFVVGHAEMERSFKVFIYRDGNPGTFYQTPWKLTGKYASETYFFQNIRKSCFRTNDPNRTHLFFIPIPPQDARQVILSDYYDLPFSDILDWRKFAVVLESDVYQLKSILKSKSQEEFVALHKSLVQVQKHFEWHSPPVPYDAFHIVMYELWLRHHVIKY